MRNFTVALFCCVFLTACANDVYFPQTASLSQDLRSCKQQVIHDDIARNLSGGQLYAGPIIGAFQGMAQQAKNNPNAEIEACMASKGYTGTSEN